MASEYLKQKYKDVKPDAPRELTREETRKNWWAYHKWHVAAAVIGALIAADLVWGFLGRGTPEPDCQIGYVGAMRLPDDTVAALETSIAALTKDLNGDGKAVVKVRQYVSDPEGDPQVVAAANVQLMVDVMEQESFIFLLEDPESFQASYHTLSRLDGSLPEDGDDSVEGSVLAWSDCPVLAELELGGYSYDVFGAEITGKSQALLSELYVARRGFWNDTEDAGLQAGRTALWETLTSGRAEPAVTFAP